MLRKKRTSERWECAIPRATAVCHHFSYARPSERIRQKLQNTLHRDEIVPNWFEEVWLKWDTDHSLEDLHPTNPPEFKRAVRVDIASLPEVMRDHPFAARQ